MNQTARYEQFRFDLTDAGYSVRDYNGRNFYSGTAVTLRRDELQYVMRVTSVKLQWDQLGKDGVVVYPK